jgi:hypothetical protein
MTPVEFSCLCPRIGPGPVGQLVANLVISDRRPVIADQLVRPGRVSITVADRFQSCAYSAITVDESISDLAGDVAADIVVEQLRVRGSAPFVVLAFQLAESVIPLL